MIRVLDKKVADKIAAGEVVERPISVIKELVENSIDANSTKITVEIKNGGKSYIRITDNGDGIENEECRIAFLRHATSKISDASDLYAINTLGFRGEALASICAVSRLELVSKKRENSVGQKIHIEGGDIIEDMVCGAADGTTIIIRDLFYNIPARLKFLKNDRAEASAIITFVTNIALAYPHISIRLVNNENTLFVTRGNGDRLKAIQAVASGDISSNLLPVSYKNEDLSISGYISRVDLSKTTKKNQVFFVNGRVVDNKIIENAVSRAYSDRLFDGRYPVCYLFLEADPASMDVNIHPNKMQIKFYDNTKVENAVYEAIIETLRSREAVPELEIKATKSSNTYTDKSRSDDAFKINEIETEVIEQIKGNDSYTGNSFYTEKGFSRVRENSIESIFGDYRLNIEEQEEKSENRNVENDERENKYRNVENDGTENKYNIADKDIEIYKQIEIDKQINIDKARYKNVSNVDLSQQRLSVEEKEEQKGFVLSSLSIHDQIFGTYILLSDGDNLYLLDQHAAHERVLFEEILQKFNDKNEDISIQKILVPIIIDVDHSEKNRESEWLECLRNFNFEIEEFGPLTYKVTGIPTYFDLSEAETFLKDFVEMIDEVKSFEDKNTLDKIATKACKAAVKGNDSMDKRDVENLIKSMSFCKNPYSCPHGRPTFIKISKYELERKFKRK
ncbi:MAG: DNA mismatch repair endonuclease MutL [Eubacteriales bacterium]|nr:DNA mismatch repair endonuclease MutL [Eubacteriales bacterium]MDY3333092.1 DNA mismatch repair endonuclease MutL [Gallibacter sp.]